jgi:propanediol dehydratase large subunit
MALGDTDIWTLMYIGIGVFAYLTILFLTFRDMRIFRRTGYVSYRKGAFKGIVASSVVLIGIFSILAMQLLGLGLIFLGLMLNQKGARENVFTTANALNRFIGQTDIVLTNEEKKELYEQQMADKKRMEKEKERADRNEKLREKREKEES